VSVPEYVISHAELIICKNNKSAKRCKTLQSSGVRYSQRQRCLEIDAAARARAHLCKLSVCVRPAALNPQLQTPEHVAVASYHLCVKPVSRSAGRSAIAAAAYRAGVEIADVRTGEVHNYTRKKGVESVQILLPVNAPTWAVDRATLWNAVEQAETRKNSTVAREFEIALPAELSAAERQRLAHDFAREIVERHGCAADVAIHAPGKQGDHRNHHAHILVTTRRLGSAGFTEKTRELDDKKTGPVLVVEWRERFAKLQNERLQEAGVDDRVDHRSLEAQGIDRVPTFHLGPTAAAIERRTGRSSRRRLDFRMEIESRLARAKQIGELERQLRQVNFGIFLETNMAERMVLQEQAAAALEAQRQAAAANMKVLASSPVAERSRPEGQEQPLRPKPPGGGRTPRPSM